MAKLNFNVHGYRFEKAINDLRTGFLSAVKALEGEVEGAKKDAAGYQQSLGQGGAWIGEIDEDGYVLWDHESVLEMRIEAREEALMALRKVFVITFYHYWERSIRASTHIAAKNHTELVKSAREGGIPIDPRLNAVRDLVNTLKHNEDKWGKKLCVSWRALFSPDFEPQSKKTDWYGAIHLQDIHVLEVVEIVSRSGPTAGLA
jgi:hypothetical protein